MQTDEETTRIAKYISQHMGEESFAQATQNSGNLEQRALEWLSTVMVLLIFQKVNHEERTDGSGEPEGVDVELNGIRVNIQLKSIRSKDAAMAEHLNGQN